MATYVLIHGAGDVGWYWHLVALELTKAGHTIVAPDMPIDDESAMLSDYADAVIAHVAERNDLIVVAQSFGGYVAPIVAERLHANLIVLVAAMVPAPGESAMQMFESTSYDQEPQEDSSDTAVFMHDVPRELAVEALSKGRDQSDTGFSDPWPLTTWPAIPTKAIVGSIDRLFPVEWLSKVTEERLGVVPERIESGHCVALSQPAELARRLESMRIDAGIA
ncbi:MAG: alpha/beta hydrolase [Thermomicrobiales bacterium]